MTEPALVLRGVTKTYRHGMLDVNAVRDLDLEVAAGSITAITGPSGSGKSTVLHLAAGMVIASAGIVRVAGTDLAGRSPAELAELRRTAVGVVFQQYNLVPSLTATENVSLPLELEGTSIKVNAACPGYTATDLNRFTGTRTVEQAAREPVRLALLDASGPTGTFSNEAGPLPW